ncbi:hypothetical protein [Mucilaginibacter sp.]|uniref:hypothetical protein n=1 Tax=Mucilaginibacter sp. TaxID=1882438 RepID=UPI0025E7001D|nr:hypothetical protein [Mucilaginibacter sp.]
MEEKYVFNDEAFNLHFNCPLVELEQFIYKSEKWIINARKRPFRFPKDAIFYNEQYSTLKVLELILKLRKGFITSEQFDEKVKIKKVSISN